MTDNQPANVIDLSDRAAAMTALVNGQRNDMFGPGVTMPPTSNEGEPRLFEYRPGINLMIQPRAGFNQAPFAMLRNLSYACKEARLNIELIKRQIRALSWEIVPEDKKQPLDPAQLREVLNFWEKPDGVNDFDTWVSMALDAVLENDALTIYPQSDRAGRLLYAYVIDGATIRPVLDLRGRVARPPAPAYVQVLYGVPWTWYDARSLIYKPMNKVAWTPYGTAPLEYIVLAANLMLRREIFKVAGFTEGNIPEGMAGVPDDWTVDQIQTWQTYWDGLISGNVVQQRHLIWVPSRKNGDLPVYEFKQNEMEQTVLDEWLLRVACWAYGNNPAEFGITGGAGLGGSGYTQSMENAQYRSMFGPITQYLANLITSIIKTRQGLRNGKFAWQGMEPSEDELKKAQTDQANIDMGKYSVAYVQDRDGVPEEFRPAKVPEKPAPILPQPDQLARAAQASHDQHQADLAEALKIAAAALREVRHV